MEVVKCRLCKEEIKYSQRCRVYIKTDEPRSAQRSSKRPHIGRYKVISTAPSTEHISFSRRLKNLRKKQTIVCNQNNSSESSSTELLSKTNSQEEEPLSAQKPEILEKVAEETTIVQEVLPEQKVILANLTESESKNSLSTEKESNKTEPQPEAMSHPQFQSSFEDYIKPIISKTPGKVKKTKSSDSNSDLEVNRKGSTNTYKLTKNGTRGNPAKEFESYFWLELPKSKGVEPRKLAYQFENLVSEVKHMKLPSSEWKIKIMVHKQEMVSVSFNYKQVPEKSVSVNAKSSVCDISIDSKKLILLGSPVYIYSIKDLEVLLDIMNDIGPESPLIQYL